MINLEIIQAALENTLSTDAAGRFVTLDFKTARGHGDFYLDNQRTVQVYFEEAEIPKDRSGRNGPLCHVLTFKLILTVSKRTVADLNILNSPVATPAQKATAMAAVKGASIEAEKSINELYGIVLNILRDNQNKYLKLADERIVIDGWVEGFKKLNLQDRSRQGISELFGDVVVFLGELTYTCHTFEVVTGAMPDATQPKTLDVSMSFQNDNLGAPIVNAEVISTQGA